jgi:hypothetical protein
MMITCNCIADLPKLSWIAIIDQKSMLVKVLHGRSVEVHDAWVVEGVWDGEFSEGHFHRSENFFGSGIRVEDGKVYFAASSASVDRIFYCRTGRQIIVANSLVNLLAYTDAALDENHDYVQETTSIFKGEKHYRKEYKIIHPTIPCFYQIFYENMIVIDGEITFESRNQPLDKIVSFEDYHARLSSILGRIRRNYESELRQHKVFPLATLSSGYDSTAVAVLVKDIGVSTCYTSRKSNSWLPPLVRCMTNDDGTDAAKALKLRWIYLDNRVKNISDDELYYLATTYAKFHSQICISEIVYHSMADDIGKKYEAAVLFNGIHGDKVWDVNAQEEYLVDDIIRPDTAGQNISEIRLKSGLWNVPVPFILARAINNIVDISRSDEMRNWRLDSDYDRPVPRRIAETAGVKRGTFAMRKKAAFSWSYRYPHNRVLRKQYFQYLKNHHGISPLTAYFIHYLNQLQVVAQKAMHAFGMRSKAYQQTMFWKQTDLTFLMWIWAIGELKKKMAAILSEYR